MLCFLFIGYINAELTSTELNLFRELETRLSSVENELERQKDLNRNLETRLNAQSTLLSTFMANDGLGDVTHRNTKNGRVGKLIF